MKFFSIVFSIGSIAATAVSALQNLRSSDAQLNISSPIQNGIYVAGKILPLTYIPAIPANLKLNIYLRGISVSFNETTIANDADVSNNPENAVHVPEDQSVYYQHSINYDIPITTPAGDYEVIYQNANTNVNTSIPISILASVMPSSTLISLSPAVTTAAESSVAINFTSVAPTESTQITATSL